MRLNTLLILTGVVVAIVGALSLGVALATSLALDEFTTGSGEPLDAQLSAPDSALANLPVPLLIREALADDPAQEGFQLLAGMARSQEPVTLGLPLPEDAGITSTGQLGLAGALVGQFRVLQRWSNGNIKWLLVDTQADVLSGTQSTTISLTTGAGSFGGPALAADRGMTISVDTGPAQFVIRKQGFNLLDSVVVSGVTLIAPGDSPGIVLISGTTTYQASNDANVQVSVEENGPARAVILAKGAHYSTLGQRNLDFTVRLHFYKGESQARVLYTLRNASKEQFVNAPLTSLELVLRTTLSPPQVVFGLDSTEYAATLTNTDAMYLFQGENAFPTERAGWDDPLVNPTLRQGYELTRNGSTVITGTREQIINLFYAGARDAGGNAATIGTRFAAGWYPQGLGIDGDGTLRVGLWPTGNDKTFYTRFNSWATREVLLDFTRPVSASIHTTPRAAFFKFQYPLAGKAQDKEWYNRTGAVWERLASFMDEYNYNVSQGWADPNQPITFCHPGDTNTCASLPRDMRPNFILWRSWGWRAGGGDNQYDSVRRGLLNFLREDAPYGPAYLLSAGQRASFVADRAILHSDDYAIGEGDATSSIPGYVGNNDAYASAPNYAYVQVYGDALEYDHPHASGVGLGYFLTGDERLREAYLQWGEVLLTPNDFEHGDRPLAWLIYNLTDMYRFTGQRVFRDQAWTFLGDEVLNRSAISGLAYGTDGHRGFYVAMHDQWDWGGDLYQERSMAPFIKATMYPRSYAYFHDFGAESNLEADRTRDVLEGIVRYAANELWYEYSQQLNDFGFPYRDSPDYQPPLRDVRLDEDWYGGVRECFATFIYGYLLTGDGEFLRKGNLLLKGVAWGQNTWNYNYPEKEALTHLLQHTGEYAVWRPLTVTAQNNDGGSYTLSWTVPANAHQYWIKYAEKPIVPWLNYDKFTAQYQYSPTQYSAFFAAQNVVTEPVPTAPGAVQTHTVTGLDPAKTYYFAARYQTAMGSAPLAPVISGQQVSEGVTLRWTQTESNVTGYQVYQSTQPYFTPGGADSQLIGNVPPSSVGNAASFTDTSAFAAPLTNYYYAVLAVAAGGVKSPVSNRVGTFSFILAPTETRDVWR